MSAIALPALLYSAYLGGSLVYKVRLRALSRSDFAVRRGRQAAGRRAEAQGAVGLASIAMYSSVVLVYHERARQRRKVTARPREQLERRPDLDQPAGAHHGDPVAAQDRRDAVRLCGQTGSSAIDARR